VLLGRTQYTIDQVLQCLCMHDSYYCEFNVYVVIDVIMNSSVDIEYSQLCVCSTVQYSGTLASLERSP
jgi:hypothetical protein